MFEVIWKIKAIKQLKKIPATDQKKIYSAAGSLQNQADWKDVKPLTNHQYDYRMRVGRYRILFNCEYEIRIIRIEEVKKRDERTY